MIELNKNKLVISGSLHEIIDEISSIIAHVAKTSIDGTEVTGGYVIDRINKLTDIKILMLEGKDPEDAIKVLGYEDDIQYEKEGE